MPADDSSRPCSVNNVLGGQYSLVSNVRGDSSPVNNVREGTSMGGGGDTTL